MKLLPEFIALCNVILTLSPLRDEVYFLTLSLAWTYDFL